MADNWRRHRALVALAAFGLTSCATPSPQWMRPDGQAISPQQMTLDRAACQGETQKANMGAGENMAIAGYSRQMLEVYNGCMAAHGYLPLDK